MIRKMFGPYERQIAEAYRSIYIDIDAFVQQLHRWKPDAVRILEVGCGEGAVTQRLSVAYPAAEITAIDVTPRVGRLFQGCSSRVRFLQSTVQEVAISEGERFDLVVLSDVLHHVPEEIRQSLLAAIRDALAPGASFVFKDWERSNAPIHWLCYASDRWLTGDRISYMSRSEMRQRLARVFGDAALMDEMRVKPWWNNLATLVKP